MTQIDAPSFINWYVASWDAPANISREPRQESIQVNPNDIGVKPVTNPKGTIPGKKGSIACMPCMKQCLSCLDCFKFMLGRYSKLKKHRKVLKVSKNTYPQTLWITMGFIFGHHSKYLICLLSLKLSKNDTNNLPSLIIIIFNELRGKSKSSDVSTSVFRCVVC